MLTYLLALVNPVSVGQQVPAAAFLTPVDWFPLYPTHLLTDLFCRLVSSAPFCWQYPSLFDRPLVPTGLCCSLLLTAFFCLLSDLPFLVHFRSRGRSRTQALCVGFAPKKKKRDSLSLTPTETNATYCVTCTNNSVKENNDTKGLTETIKRSCFWIKTNVGCFKMFAVTCFPVIKCLVGW